MEPVSHKGQLITWKDDRGFGFIKPNDDGKEVFLHISVLKGAVRPKVGDTIFYEQVANPNGKMRAVRASIQGIAPRPLPTKSKPKKGNLLETVVGLAILAATALFAMQLSPGRSPSPLAAITKPGCVVKGNISVGTNSKVYHLPGMEDYGSTAIDSASREKWFCTESEVITNGWRKAPR